MKVARFRFDSDLRSLLQRPHDDGEFEFRFNGPQSVKHLIESWGIPHTEIGGVRVEAQLVSTAYLVRDGDRVEAYGNAAGVSQPAEPRFVIDGHLGRLNAHLRMLGLDCLYDNAYDDRALLHDSLKEDRLLLTRDRRLLMHKAIQLGYLLRSLEPAEQLREVVQRFGLQRWIRPFQRCIRCNHLLEVVSKQAIIDRLEPLTRLYFEEFRICPACKQIYWKGSHFDRMELLIANLGNYDTKTSS
jgi:hypothetical protein